MSAAALLDLAGLLLLGVGLLVCGLGTLGLVRMPDAYTRLHAGSKVFTIGSTTALVGVAVLSPFPVALKALGVAVFLLLTTPIASYATARAAHASRAPRTRHTIRDDLGSSERAGPEGT